MPLKGSVGDMIKEIMHSYRRKKSIGTSHPKSSKKAHEMAVAIAMQKHEKGKKK